MTELDYRLAWARTYLKAYGLLENSERGVWSLTADGRVIEKVDPVAVQHAGRKRSRTRKHKKTVPDRSEENLDVAASEAILAEGWRDDLLEALLSLPPAAFERLCQRLLRESGFVQVEVTGRSGDGGIDGLGIVRLGGLLGFPILFQCKRYRGTVSPGDIRDFRGALMGRADRGLFITTGTFSGEARREAKRDGASPIDLLDGSELVDKLKELRLGVEVRTVEEVTVRHEWFESV